MVKKVTGYLEAIKPALDNNIYEAVEPSTLSCRETRHN